eukprot:TRINITY_DN51_c0_g6_i1.p1 TRINITY_DN51_c0_g6~~TRINITY_DN51_c0_g6_i1.p1  ORF type:complete len:426 (+),score=95.72 TRINITY_DN51_c0_g6_i1:289-1566(+)
MYANESSIVSNLMLKFSNVPSFAPSTNNATESTSQQSTPIFSATSTSNQRASEERRNRKLKRQEKTKQHQKQQSQQPQKPQLISEPAVPVIPLDDEYEMKKQKRLLRNRQAAQQSRERKKHKIMQLEEEMGRMVEENAQLKHRVQQLEALLKGNSTIFTSPSPEITVPFTSSGMLSFDSCSQDEVLQYDELATPVEESPSSPGLLTQQSPENPDVNSFTPLTSSDDCLWPDFYVQSPQQHLQYLQNLQNLQDDQQYQNQQLRHLGDQDDQQYQFGSNQKIEDKQETEAYSSESAALTSISLPMEEAQVLSSIQSSQVLQVACYLIYLSWIHLSVIQFAADQVINNPMVADEEQQQQQQQQQESESDKQSQQPSDASDSGAAAAMVARRPKSRWKLADQLQQLTLDCGRGSSNLVLPSVVNTVLVC